MKGTAHPSPHRTHPHPPAGTSDVTLALLGAGQGQAVPRPCLVPYALVTMYPQGRKTRPWSQRRDFIVGEGDGWAMGASGLWGRPVWGHWGPCLWRKERAGGVRGQWKQLLQPSPCSTMPWGLAWLTLALQSAAGKVQKPQAHSHLSGWCGVRDVGCKVWDAEEEYGRQDIGFRMQGAGSGCGVQDTGCGTWGMTWGCRIGMQVGTDPVLRSGRCPWQCRCPGACPRSAALR